MTGPLLMLLGLLAGTTGAPASQTAPPAPVAASSTTAPAVPPVLREISPGIFDYQGIRLDKKKRRISFPGTVNMRVGLIEYLLVNEKGKIHESLLATKVLPHDIHLALLLIGLKEDSKANSKEPVPPSAIDTSYLHSAPKLKGSPVRISVAWTEDGKRKEIPAEDWIFNLQTNHPMTTGPWTYNGSWCRTASFSPTRNSPLSPSSPTPPRLSTIPARATIMRKSGRCRTRSSRPWILPSKSASHSQESTPPTKTMKRSTFIRLALGASATWGRHFPPSPRPSPGANRPLTFPPLAKNRSLQLEIERSIEKGLAFLKSKQDPAGFWSSADYPALSGLVLLGLHQRTVRRPSRPSIPISWKRVTTI